ncbi:MAG TPA: glycosyltransferase family 39 protein, partial [Bacteroidia bacterium]|nr:glycosyltransferase family 39 protein [Bacteroidia bacterium]
GGNGIFYILQLHFWCKLFGATDVAVRMLSALYGIALLFSVYYIAKKKFKIPALAIGATAVAAFHPLLIMYAREARPYAAATFYTIWSSYFLFHCFFSYQPNSKPHVVNILFYIVATLAALLCHYLTAYIFITQGLWVIIYLRKRIRIFYFLVAVSLAATGLSLWMYVAGLKGMAVMHAHNNYYVTELSKNSDFVQPTTFLNCIIGSIQFALPALGNSLQKSGLQLREIILLLLIPLHLIYVAWRKADKSIRKYLNYCILSLPVAVLFITALAINAGHTISYQPHYANFVAAQLVFIMGVGCVYAFWQHKNVVLNRLVIISFALILSGTISFYFLKPLNVYSNDVKNPYQFIALKISETSKTDTIYFPNITDAQLAYMYLKPTERIFSINASSTCVYINDKQQTILDLNKLRY